MRNCAVCGKAEKCEEHHGIPKFLYKILDIKSNPDLFRILLCEYHHRQWTAEWNKFRFELKRRLNND